MPLVYTYVPHVRVHDRMYTHARIRRRYAVCTYGRRTCTGIPIRILVPVVVDTFFELSRISCAAMAYLPPHKRISDSSRPRPAMASPSPSAAAASSSQHSRPPCGRKSHLPLPGLSIYRSRDYIGRFIIVLPENAPGSQQLEFVRFDGESFAHLRDFPLYALQLSGKLEKWTFGHPTAGMIMFGNPKANTDDVRRWLEGHLVALGSR